MTRGRPLAILVGALLLSVSVVVVVDRGRVEAQPPYHIAPPCTDLPCKYSGGFRGTAFSVTNEAGRAMSASSLTSTALTVSTDSPNAKALHIQGRGDLIWAPAAGSSTPKFRVANNGDVYTQGKVGIGTQTNDVRLNVDGTTRTTVLELEGADVAERLPVSEHVRPGDVVEIDPEHPGSLRVSRNEYSRSVAGVVSGAGDLAPGAVLGNLPDHEDAPPITLSGRVWVRCDATDHAVEIGDLLTTAKKDGHAMSVEDLGRAHGATLGKAMTRLDEGESGLVLVLVNLL